jgi:hypothetical protein
MTKRTRPTEKERLVTKAVASENGCRLSDCAPCIDPIGGGGNCLRHARAAIRAFDGEGMGGKDAD